MAHTPLKSYSKGDFILQLKEIQDEIQLEKNKIEILRREHSGLSSWNKSFIKSASENLEAIKLEHDELAEDIRELVNTEKDIINSIQKKNHQLVKLVEQREIEKKYFVELHDKNKQLLDESLDFIDSFEKAKDKKIKEYNKVIEELEKKRDSIEIKEFDFAKREVYIKTREIELDVRDNLIVQKERVAERYSRRIVKDFEEKYPKSKIKYI